MVVENHHPKLCEQQARSFCKKNITPKTMLLCNSTFNLQTLMKGAYINYNHTATYSSILCPLKNRSQVALCKPQDFVNLAVNKDLFVIGTVHWKFVAWFQAEHTGLCLEWSIWRRVCVLLRFLISLPMVCLGFPYRRAVDTFLMQLFWWMSVVISKACLLFYCYSKMALLPFAIPCTFLQLHNIRSSEDQRPPLPSSLPWSSLQQHGELDPLSDTGSRDGPLGCPSLCTRTSCSTPEHTGNCFVSPLSIKSFCRYKTKHASVFRDTNVSSSASMLSS
jgi:hypothetical protein